jgi:hypothetical protein
MSGWIFVGLEASNKVEAAEPQKAAPTKAKRSKGRSTGKVALDRGNFLTPEALSYRW